MNPDEKDVCTKGKSCKTACIKSNLICRESFNASVQSNLPKLVGKISEFSGRISPRPNPQNSEASATIDKGKGFLAKFNKQIEESVKLAGKYGDTIANIEEVLKDPKLNPKDRNALGTRLISLQKDRIANDQKLVALMSQVRAEMLKSRLSASQINQIVNNVDVIKAGDRTGAIKGQLGEFARMFNGLGFANVKETPETVYPLTSVLFEKRRGWASHEMGHMGLTGDKSTTFHEMGHFVEMQRPWLRDYTEKWRDRRAWDQDMVNQMHGGDPPRSVGKLGNSNIPLFQMKNLVGYDGYEKSEAGVMDEFLNPYMGKVYKSGVTEVLSMSIEHFSSPEGMARLRRFDPDLFNLVVGLSVR